MSMCKFVTALTLATSLLSGCAPEAPRELLSTEQTLKGGGTWSAGNSSQAFGGSVQATTVKGLYYSTTPPRGQAASPTGWWVRSQSADQHAQVLAITFNGEAVSALGTSQGFFQVTIGDDIRTMSSDDVLELELGTPLSATLRLSGSQDEDSYGKYLAEWRTGSGAWQSFCPHTYGTSDGEMLTQTEYVIPIGGAYWHNSGTRINSAASIQLSCTHDSIGACVTWGYAPWDSVTRYTGTPPKLTTTSLVDAHQACTRLKRNDVCGTGDAVTTIDQNSYLHTTIQVWDTLGIHGSGPQTASTMEAFWDTSGATCYNLSGFRTDAPYAYEHLLIQLASCPKPACDLTQPGLLGSARPCLATHPVTGECTQN